jgi:hypothetical protein
MYLLDTLFRDDLSKIYEPWDMDRVWADVRKWKTPTSPLYVYVIANDLTGRGPRVWVGCNADLKRRVEEINAGRGGPSGVKKARGRWKLVMTIAIPPFRNYSAKEMKKTCKAAKGWTSRLKKTVAMATFKGLTWKISRSMLDPDSIYYCKEAAELIKDSEIHDPGQNHLLD